VIPKEGSCVLHDYQKLDTLAMVLIWEYWKRATTTNQQQLQS